MKNAVIFILGCLAGAYLYKKVQPMPGVMNIDYLSLDNIRRGIENMWYTATIKQLDGEFFAHLVGTKTDGETSDAYYPITEDTYISLKEDGVEEEE